MQCEHPAIHSFFPGCFCSGFDGAFRQTGQLGFIGQSQLIVIGFFQVIFTEIQCQFTKILCQLAIFLLGFSLQVGSATNKSVISVFQKLGLFRSQLYGILLTVYNFDTFEEFLIQADVIAVFA